MTLILFWMKELRLRLVKSFLRSCVLVRDGIKSRALFLQLYHALLYWSWKSEDPGLPQVLSLTSSEILHGSLNFWLFFLISKAPSITSIQRASSQRVMNPIMLFWMREKISENPDWCFYWAFNSQEKGDIVGLGHSSNYSLQDAWRHLVILN